MSISDKARANVQQIIDGMNHVTGQNASQSAIQGVSYMGTTKTYFPIRAAQVGEVARQFAENHSDLTIEEFLATLDLLAQSRLHNEFMMIGVLLGRFPRLRKQMDPWALSPWIERAEGWAEVDVICQSSFSAAEVLNNWQQWQALLRAFCCSPNIHKRRASLVLLTRPLRESADHRLSEMAFENASALECEQHILITKAISWILRSLVKYHKPEVEAYLAVHSATLPKIALRETRNKLKTGRKSGK